MDQIASCPPANEPQKNQQHQAQKSKKKIKNKKQTLNLETNINITSSSTSPSPSTIKTVEVNGVTDNSNHHSSFTNGIDENSKEQLNIEDKNEENCNSYQKFNGAANENHDYAGIQNDQIHAMNGYHNYNSKSSEKSKSLQLLANNCFEEMEEVLSTNQKILNKSNIKQKNKVVDHCHTKALNAVNSVVQELKQLPVLSKARESTIAKKFENGFIEASLEKLSLKESGTEQTTKTVTTKQLDKTVDDNKRIIIETTACNGESTPNSLNSHHQEALLESSCRKGTGKKTRNAANNAVDEALKKAALSILARNSAGHDAAAAAAATIVANISSDDYAGTYPIDYNDDIPTTSSAAALLINKSLTTAKSKKDEAETKKFANADDKNDTNKEIATEVTPTLLGNIDPSEIIYKEYESELQMHDIMRLIQSELSEPYSIYTYRYFIYNWPKLCFLAAHGNEYVGAIVCKLDMHMNVRRGYIAMLAVRKDYRKMKIGTTLVQKAIDAMLVDKADEVVLETEMRNIPALRLYENLGFVRDKRLFRYYLNGVDALRLKLWFR